MVSNNYDLAILINIILVSDLSSLWDDFYKFILFKILVIELKSRVFCLRPGSVIFLSGFQQDTCNGELAALNMPHDVGCLKSTDDCRKMNAQQSQPSGASSRARGWQFGDSVVRALQQMTTISVFTFSFRD